ncbi:hypothetical protein [Carnobacterium antarcticum]|uniref:Uncharacterized protein n=1 Tax=Carnobacterium antarcticum TaxID=2126436 RepID=A0ABW4NLS4_9LACT|nr:hypothetical protein [Carnobacterium sp. CP1]ALV21075.1 hypothetical protein NY10_455 [Carnobacterium sp. CP1]
MKEVEAPSLDNHEKRIYKLEQSNEDIQKNIKELKDSVLINQAQSAERSKIMMSQNESLMKQNERLSEQMGSVFNTVTTTREKEAERSSEMKKLSTDTRMKLLAMVFGGGSAGYLVIQTILNLLGK